MNILEQIDSLTGIYNGRFWEYQLPLELERSQITKKPVSIVLIAIDDFPEFDKIWGRQASDDLLCQITQAWKPQLRRIDFLVRYGEQELGLILSGCDGSNALKLIDRLRHSFPEGHTFCAGVATWNYREKWQSLLARAFQALDRAKQTGKNQIAIGS